MSSGSTGADVGAQHVHCQVVRDRRQPGPYRAAPNTGRRNRRVNAPGSRKRLALMTGAAR
jgi:hypothetical protein